MSALTLLASIDWEGATLKEENVSAIEKFNRRYPDVPFTHFICPSYFTRGFDPEPIARLVKQAIKQGDEIALHVHCWDSLVSAAEVTYRKSPTWNPDNKPGEGIPKKDGKLDYGHDVPLGAYEPDEIVTILTYARQLLAAFKLIDDPGECVGFRCGGWVACTNVLEALARLESFTYDASGAPYLFFKELNSKESMPLYNWIDDMWGQNAIQEPMYLSNDLTYRAYPGGVTGLDPSAPTISQAEHLDAVNLLEIPNTAALADYNTVASLKEYIDRAVRQAQTGREVHISMGFHDENATDENFDDPEYTNIEVFTQGVEYFKAQGGVMRTRRALAATLR